MQKTLIEELSDNELFPTILMLEYRAGHLKSSLCESISNLLRDNLSKQAELVKEEPYRSIILNNRIDAGDLELWKNGSLSPPKRRIAVDQYIKASLTQLSDNKDLTKIHELNQFVFLHRFEAYAKYYPNQPALLFNDQRLTYAQLNARANQMAYFLLEQKKARGLDPAQEFIVGTFLPREPEWIIAILAIWKAGGAFIAIDPTAIGNSPDAIDDYFDKFAQTLSDGKPAFILTHSDHQYLLPKPQKHGFFCLCLDDCEEAIKLLPTENTDIKIDPEDLAYILYTSGSSGKPKGVEIAHRGFMPCLEAHRECVDLTRDSIMAQYATCDFDAWVAETLILGIGGTLAIVPSEIRLDEKRCAQYYRDHKINVVIFTPAFLNKLGGPEYFPLWKALFIVGESFDWELVKKWKTDQLQIVNGYGLTETTICATLENLDIDEVGKPLSIGKAILGTKIIIKIPTNIDTEEYGQGTLYQNPESPQSVIDQAGEPWFGGISLTRGYRGEAMINNHWRFVEIEGERYYKSGDKAILRADGRLEHQGRYSRMVKISGKRIELPSIEANLCEHFQLEKMHVAVTAVGNSLEDKNLTTLLVFLVENENQKLDDAVIREFIINTEKNIDKQSPLHIIWKKVFPTTHTKINLVELNKSYFETHAKKTHEASSVDSKISSDEKEILAKLQNCWKEVLSKNDLPLEDDFFLIGGRSIDISPLIQAIRLAFPEIKDEINNALALECKTLLSQTKRLYSLRDPVKLPDLKKKQNLDAPYIIFCPPSILGNPEQDYSEFVSQCEQGFKKPYFDERFQIYGLKARGLTDPSLMPTTLYSMAQDYALTIKHWIEKHNKKDIPIFILGWSSGGTVSPEIVNALAKYQISAYAYVCDSIAPFPFHHFTEEEHTRELILLAEKLSSDTGLQIDAQALSNELINVQKPRDRIIYCFDYLIQRANEIHKNILRTTKIIRLAEHNYIIREDLQPFILYKAKNYLLDEILDPTKTSYWPKKCIRDIDRPEENIIDGNHFEMMQQPVLAQKITTQIYNDYAYHKVKKVTEVLEKQSDYVVPFIKILESNLKDEEKGQRPSVPLSQALTDFLENPQKTVLLLQGESGIGKTIAITQFEKSLKFLNMPFKTLFLNRYTCEELQKSIREELKEWSKESAEVRVVILEGYDERQGSTLKDYNYYSTNGLNDYQNLKVVFTCRTEKLKPGYLTNFLPSDKEAFEEYKLQRFNKDQIKSLMAIHLRKNNIAFSKNDVDSLYQNIASKPELLELVKNPLLLTFVLNALPKLMESTDNPTRFKIYEAFNQDYFERGELKIKSQAGIEEDQDFQSDCRLHTQRIALAFFAEGLTSHNIDNKKQRSLLSSKKKEKNPLDRLFTSEHKNILKASPLQLQENTYQFIHKSELEYFVVNALIDILNDEDIAFEEIQNWFIENKLTPQQLVSNESIIQFWQEAYHQYPEIKSKLFNIIYATREQIELAEIGGVSITLLNIASERFINWNFKGIKLKNAIIDRGIFSHVCFDDSLLKNISCFKTWLYGCTFKRADISNIEFGELPSLVWLTNFRSIEFSNVDNSLIITDDKSDTYKYDIEIDDSPTYIDKIAKADDSESNSNGSAMSHNDHSSPTLRFDFSKNITQWHKKHPKTQTIEATSANNKVKAIANRPFNGYVSLSYFGKNKHFKVDAMHVYARKVKYSLDLKVDDNEIKLLAIDHTGQLLATTTGKNQIKFWNIHPNNFKHLEKLEIKIESVGSHVVLNNSGNQNFYIIPICKKHNTGISIIHNNKFTLSYINDSIILYDLKGIFKYRFTTKNRIDLLSCSFDSDFLITKTEGNAILAISLADYNLFTLRQENSKILGIWINNTGDRYFYFDGQRLFHSSLNNDIIGNLDIYHYLKEATSSTNPQKSFPDTFDQLPSDSKKIQLFSQNPLKISALTVNGNGNQCAALIKYEPNSIEHGLSCLIIWNLAVNSAEIIPIENHGFYKNSGERRLFFSQDQRFLIYDTDDNKTAIFDINLKKNMAIIEGSSAFMNTEMSVIGTINHNRILLWNFLTLVLILDFPTLINPKHAHFNNNNTILIKSDIDKYEIWQYNSKSDQWQLNDTSAIKSQSCCLENTNFHESRGINKITTKLILQKAGYFSPTPAAKQYKTAFFDSKIQMETDKDDHVHAELHIKEGENKL